MEQSDATSLETISTAEVATDGDGTTLSRGSSATRQEEWSYWASLEWQRMPFQVRLSEWKRHLAGLDLPFDSFRDQAIVDVGCGPVGVGYFVSAKRRVGVDPLAGEYARWNGYWGEPIELIEAEGEKLPLRSESFDAAFCVNCLDHTFDPGKILQEIGRILKPGGMLILHVDLDSPLRKLHKLIKSVSGTRHPQSLNYVWLEEQLDATFFAVVKVYRDPMVFRLCWSQIRYEAFWDGLIYRLTRRNTFINHIWLKAIKRPRPGAPGSLHDPNR